MESEIRSHMESLYADEGQPQAFDGFLLVYVFLFVGSSR